MLNVWSALVWWEADEGHVGCAGCQQPPVFEVDWATEARSLCVKNCIGGQSHLRHLSWCDWSLPRRVCIKRLYKQPVAMSIYVLQNDWRNTTIIQEGVCQLAKRSVIPFDDIIEFRSPFRRLSERDIFFWTSTNFLVLTKHRLTFLFCIGLVFLLFTYSDPKSHLNRVTCHLRRFISERNFSRTLFNSAADLVYIK